MHINATFLLFFSLQLFSSTLRDTFVPQSRRLGLLLFDGRSSELEREPDGRLLVAVILFVFLFLLSWRLTVGFGWGRSEGFTFAVEWMEIL